MELGPFSLSLVVSNIDESVSFYNLLGFNVLDGGHINEAYPDTDETKWRILEKESIKLGVFQGMFEKNILTFNPSDVRGIQKKLKNSGIELIQEVDENTTGPGFITLEDPDGNLIMFDQY